jgi:hypothetical protein
MRPRRQVVRIIAVDILINVDADPSRDREFVRPIRFRAHDVCQLPVRCGSRRGAAAHAEEAKWNAINISSIGVLTNAPLFPDVASKAAPTRSPGARRRNRRCRHQVLTINMPLVRR